jgi:uncharacterized protein
MPESGPTPDGVAASGGAAEPQRSGFADALRGFALVGICVANLPWIASAWPGGGSALDGAARLLVAALVEAKFFVLFSLLFGFGFQRQLARVRAGQAAPAAYARRLSGLFVLGALHATLLYVGDILVTYALLGAVLWLLRDLPDARLLRIARVCVAVAAAAFALLAWSYTGEHDAAAAAAEQAAARRAYLGGFGEALARRLQDLPLGAAGVILFNWPLAFAAFCAGLVAGRRGLLDDPARLGRALPPAPWLAAGAVLGNLAAAASYRLPGNWPPVFYAMLAVGAPCLSALYALALARAWRSAPRARVWMEAWLAPAGRMSLSNYLGQSLAGNAVFLGWGLGLYGSLGAAALLALSLAIAAAGLAASAFWLRRFRIGPAEWLLRAWVRAGTGDPRGPRR